MKKILDLTDCKSTEQMCDKLEKELANTKKRKNNKKPNKPVKPATAEPTREEKKDEVIKLTMWQKVKNWFKKIF